MPRITMKVQVNSQLAELKSRGAAGAQKLAAATARRALKYAQENVTEGVGPGPHPHRTISPYTGKPINFRHEDSGDLRRSLQLTNISRGAIGEAGVFTDSQVGYWLEMGFTGPSGSHYKYPWLYPAFALAQADLPELARTILYGVVSEAGQMSGGTRLEEGEFDLQPTPLK